MAEKIDKILNLSPEDSANFNLYPEVDLTEDEVKAALYEARRQKYFSGRLAEYKKKISETEQYPNYTSRELYQRVWDAGFIVDEFNKQQIWDLCRYFAGDPAGPLDLRKGIMLYGPVGTYKTALMRFFANNQSNSFVVYAVNDIAAQFATDGHDALLRYKGLIQSTDTSRTFGQKELGICFDDFGTEIDKKHYGNESNVMGELILSRFMSYKNLIAKTHFTTNIDSVIIGERYGERVKSRLREIINVVAFPDDSPDRRK